MKKSGRLAVLVIPVAAIAIALTLQSFGQGQEQQQSPTNRNKSEAKPADQTQSRAASAQDLSNSHWEIPADADKTINPVATSEDSVANGKELYLARKGNCVFCHGETGAGNEENLPQLQRKPADISDKERMSKLSDGELFWKITLGIPGIMPGREKQLTAEERWHVVNYVRTLAVEKSKP